MNHKHTGFSPESLRLIGAALALQHVERNASSITPIPSTGRFVVIGTPAEVARLLEVGPLFANDGREPDWDAYAGAEGAPATTTAAPLSAEQLDKLIDRAHSLAFWLDDAGKPKSATDVRALIAQARAAGQAPTGLGVAHAELSDRLGRFAAENTALKLECDDLRAQLAAPQATAPQPVGEQAALASAIHAAAVKAGIITAGAAVSGPQLIMLCDDLARAALDQRASSAPAEPAGWRDFIEECAQSVNGSRIATIAKDLLAASPTATPSSAAPAAQAVEAAPLAHGNRGDFFLMANARRLAATSTRAIMNTTNWSFAAQLFATGSNSAHQICTDAGIDPYGFRVERAALASTQHSAKAGAERGGE